MAMDPIDLCSWPTFCGPSCIIDQVVIDSRQVGSKSSLFVALPGLNVDGHHFVEDAFRRGAKCAIVRKDFNCEGSGLLIKVDDPLRALQSLASFYRDQKKAQVIAITGSLGKTMCKDFLYQILKKSNKVCASKESFNSQIGVALSLLQIKEDHEVALIEAGISKPGEMDYLASIIKPSNAILTTIQESASSLDSKEKIAFEKSKLLNAVAPGSWILAPQDPYLNQLSSFVIHWNKRDPKLPHALVSTKYDPRVLLYEVYFPDGSAKSLKWSSPFPSAIDLINIVIKAATLLGVKKDELLDVLETYVPEPMQIELWSTLGGTTIINYTYAQDPSSVSKALQELEVFGNGRKVFIFGGLKAHEDTKLADFDKLSTLLQDSSLSTLLTVEPGQEQKTLQALYPTLNREDTVLIQGPTKIQPEQIVQGLGDAICGNRLTIDLSSVTHNIQKIKGSSKIMAMVKANAYGTDGAILSKFLESVGVTLLGVAHPDEAIILRKKGVKQEIFVINAALDEVSKLATWQFQVGISTQEMIVSLDCAAKERGVTLKVHLHVDTGMSRLGCHPRQVVTLAKSIKNHQNLHFEGIMTHFACADIFEEDAFTFSQIEYFRTSVKELEKNGLLPPYIHSANSSAALRKLFPEGNLIRIGLALYGLGGNSLHPALSLTSRIVGINLCKKGDTISYGRNYVIEKESAKIAVVPLGYFDGLHRHYSGRGKVLVRGQKAAMVGTICMDFMMIDVTGIEDVEVGDPVLIFGKDAHGNVNSIEEFAADVGTCAHELITCLGPRIQRLFTYN